LRDLPVVSRRTRGGWFLAKPPPAVASSFLIRIPVAEANPSHTPFRSRPVWARPALARDAALAASPFPAKTRPFA